MLVADIVLARKSKGWTQRFLANRIEVGLHTIKRMEKGIGSAHNLSLAMRALDFRLAGIAPGRSLSEQLLACRLKRRMPLAEAARRSDLSRTTVAELEKGGGSIASLLRLVAVVAPRARRRSPERTHWGEGDKEDRDTRFTPADFMGHIYAAFGEVDLDPCAHLASPVVARRRIMLSEGGDGLVDPWSGRLAYVNPPFSQLLRWLRRAHEEWLAGRVTTVVCLMPVRTDSSLFHETLSAVADFYLLRGRVRFLDPRGGRQHTPFSLMILSLGATADQKASLAQLLPGVWMTPQS